MFRLLSGLVLIIAVAYSFPSSATPKTILVLGDSLSAAYGIDQAQGWVFRLQGYLQQQDYDYRVVNASISGDTTRNGRNRLPAALDRHQPDIVIIELGGNDGLRGLSLQDMKRNLADMIVMCRQKSASVLLAGVQIPPNYGARYTDAFGKVYRELADQYDVALVPSLLKDVGGHSELMQEDGLHPGAAAQDIMLKNILPYLRPLLENPQAVDIRQQNH